MSTKHVALSDVQAVICASPEPWRKLFSVLLETGARYMEIATLTPQQIGVDSIKVEPHFLPDGSWWKPKRPASVRSIVVGKKLAEELYMSVPVGKLIFFPRKTYPTHARTANYYIKKLCKKLNIERFSTHQFRRVRITQALQAGADPNTVRACVGHRSLITTVGYLQDVPVNGRLPALDAEAADEPVVAQYMFLARPKNWR